MNLPLGLHVFVAMPFGTKEGIDFNQVYTVLIKPALEGAGFEVFRADEEMAAGNIRTDMFQELLLADLVVDLSINSPNVWYELGVRHALRARGVILIDCRRDTILSISIPTASCATISKTGSSTRISWRAKGPSIQRAGMNAPCSAEARSYAAVVNKKLTFTLGALRVTSSSMLVPIFKKMPAPL
jgi:hypothetical protein